MLSFKKLLQFQPRFLGPFVDKYTEFPAGLPTDLFKLAYDENDPPISRPIRIFDRFSQHVPLRSNSKLLLSPRSGSAAKDSGSEVTQVLTAFMDRHGRGHQQDWGNQSWGSSGWSAGGGARDYAGYGSASYGSHGNPSYDRGGEAPPATCAQAPVKREDESSMFQAFRPPVRLLSLIHI